jgi:hypothetical protein
MSLPDAKRSRIEIEYERLSDVWIIILKFATNKPKTLGRCRLTCKAWKNAIDTIIIGEKTVLFDRLFACSLTSLVTCGLVDQFSVFEDEFLCTIAPSRRCLVAYRREEEFASEAVAEENAKLVRRFPMYQIFLDIENIIHLHPHASAEFLIELMECGRVSRFEFSLTHKNETRFKWLKEEWFGEVLMSGRRISSERDTTDYEIGLAPFRDHKMLRKMYEFVMRTFRD